MPIDIDKLAFLSHHPIDKIVETGTYEVTNDGDTTGAQTPQKAKIVTDSINNPYSKKVFVRFVWSVDGTNFNAPDSHLIYSFTITNPAPATVTLSGLQAAVAVGISSDTIKFITANGYHGDVDDDGVTYTYTPISQTFTFKYALFEVS